MESCFIFAEGLDNNGGLALCLNERGECTYPLESYAIAELRQLQIGRKNFLIAPASVFNYQLLELPWLGEKKARAAIPYALEEKLAFPVENQHFAFARHYYHNGHYLVIICENEYVQKHQAFFQEQRLILETFTIEWFALNEGEICLTDSNLLCYLPGIIGSFKKPLLDLCLRQLPPEQTVFRFNDSMETDWPHLECLPIMSKLWVSQRLLHRPAFNLLQGNWQQKKALSSKKWMYLAAGMAFSWIFLVLFNLVIENYSLNIKINHLDDEITKIYKQFFPEAKQIISPRFRIEQWLKNNSHTEENFWILLNEVSRLQQQDNNLYIQQIVYTNSRMQLQLIAENFMQLERFKTKLSNSTLHVKQLQATSHNGKVLSTLEINL